MSKCKVCLKPIKQNHRVLMKFGKPSKDGYDIRCKATKTPNEDDKVYENLHEMIDSVKDFKFEPEDLTEEDRDEERQDWLKKQIKVEVKSDTKKSNSTVKEATDFIMKYHRFITIQETKEILYYSNGVYVKGGEVVIERLAEQLLGYQVSNAHIAEIKGHIIRSTYHGLDELDADINIINLINGLYNIEADRLLEHTPDYLSIKQKPIVYQKDAKAKLFGKFLSEVLYDRDIRTAVDIMAYTFQRDYRIENIFMLYGIGANGKTVYTNIIGALHGHDSVSNVPLSEMLKDRFALSDLENKDVNIDNELAGQTIEESSVMKRLTGNNRIRIQRKKQQAYDTVLYAKLIFNANKIPYSEDNSDAYSRRVVIVVFPNQFEGVNDDKKLLAKLTTPQEVSGIFNVCMIALRRILKIGELHINEKTIQERKVKYERVQNPIKSLMEEEVIEDSDSTLPKEDLYNAYTKFCQRYKIPVAKSYDSFCKVLKKDFELTEIRIGQKGNQKRHWAGLRLR